MKQYKLTNNILGWISFAIASYVYIATIEPTASFWDCGEFITSAYKLEVGHPPGAPFFMIIGRIFSLFAFGNAEKVPVMINTMSALSSAFTILFLFWTITHLARKMIVKTDEITQGQMIAILGSGFIGAMAYTFSDTFWFSAVEGEVYAMSSLFTAVVFWAILKWENVANEKYANRWLILIAYLMGLSIGVHLLNLLAIPAIVFVYYFKKNKISRNGIIKAGVASVLILVAVQYGIVQGVFKVASIFELFFVNTLGMGYLSGFFVFILLLFGSLAYSIVLTQTDEKPTLTAILTTVAAILAGIPFMGGHPLLAIVLMGATGFGFYYLASKHHVVLNTIMLVMTVIVIGYSSFALIMIRSMAKTPMNQNAPDNMFSMLSYLNREQYGDRPLFYGQTFNAPMTDTKDGRANYIQKDGEYKVSDHKFSRIFDSKYTMLFPRVYSDQESPDHRGGYIMWLGKDEGDFFVPRYDANDQIMTDRYGDVVYDYRTPRRPPTFGENLKFFFKYQVNYMYLRYFMWNFVGRQNDIQGSTGNTFDGNWLSGIKPLDHARLGDLDKLPDYRKNNKAYNKYYFLPLLLGLIGLFFHYRKEKNDFLIVTLLFLMTGLAIVVYLNQPPYQPRERDYAYAGSFYAFAIWIGLGVIGLYEMFSKFAPTAVSGALATVLSLVVPGILASENWDDHDRSERFMARDFASNYLNSCKPNSIIFTNGDNDTFPLWYAQEVEGIRTDVRVCNLSYLNTDWYINQMKQRAYHSPPVPFSLEYENYVVGKREAVYLDTENPNRVDIRQAMKYIKNNKDYRPDIDAHMLPANKFALPIDTNEILEKGVVRPQDAHLIEKMMKWDINRRYIRKNEVMVLDLLASANWDRPIYFALTVGPSNFVNLQDYFQVEGLAYRIVPVKSNNGDFQTGRVASDIMYKNMMEEFRWGGIDNPDVYLDENVRRMIMNLRNNFARLGEQLIKEGQKEKAVEVLDKCIELVPHETVPFSYYSILIARAYYAAGEIEKANEIINKVADVSMQEIKYFMSLNSEQIEKVSDDMQRSGALIQESIRIADQFGQKELVDKLSEDFELLMTFFQM